MVILLPKLPSNANLHLSLYHNCQPHKLETMGCKECMDFHTRLSSGSKSQTIYDNPVCIMAFPIPNPVFLEGFNYYQTRESMLDNS